MATRYERVYEQLCANVEEIKMIYQYDNNSVAFGHLILKYQFQLTDDEANDCITDGSNDNGIDAIYFEETGGEVRTHFFQFKFPKDISTLNRSMLREEALKTKEGYQAFTGNDRSFDILRWNDLLKDKREHFKTIDSYNHVLWYIRFTTSSPGDNEQILQDQINEYKQTSGYEINLNLLYAAEITSLHEKSKLNIWPSFSIKYKRSLGLFKDVNATIYHGYITLYDFYNSIKDIQTRVLEGNVRYYDSNSKVNDGIKTTLATKPDKFHLLNNGITIVCQKVDDKQTTDEFQIEKGSIVNGAQTAGTIIRYTESLSEDAKENLKNGYVYVKIVGLPDMKNLSDEMVYTLNTQNVMKTSYKISNDDVIKHIQKEINENTQYFLQIKNNEYYHLKDTKPGFDKKLKNLIDIETLIQCYVSYKGFDDLAHLAKTSKASLFNDENLKMILKEITTAECLTSYEYYLSIMELIRLYRAYRKDVNKSYILDILTISESEIDEYRFLNTGNLLILYSIGYFTRIKNRKASQSDIVYIIKSLKSLFVDKDNISNETKKKETFSNAIKIVELL